MKLVTNAGPRRRMLQRLHATLDSFRLADAARLQEVALLRRVDSKFVMSAEAVPELLEDLRDDYRIVAAGDARLATYQTVYLDTPKLDLFRDHVRGRRPRYKARVREYLERDLTFAEIKKKPAADRTLKSRKQLEPGATGLDPDALQFMQSAAARYERELRPSLRSDFGRVTLVSDRSTERVTVDVSLAFEREGARMALPELAVVEVKQARYGARTPVMLALRRRRIRPRAFSKYCAGLALLSPSVCGDYRRGRRDLFPQPESPHE